VDPQKADWIAHRRVQSAVCQERPCGSNRLERDGSLNQEFHRCEFEPQPDPFMAVADVFVGRAI